MIEKTDPRHAAATKALEAMHAFHKLQPTSGAVQWIEDSEGKVIVFTRGEYRDVMMDAINEGHVRTEYFELEGDEE